MFNFLQFHFVCRYREVYERFKYLLARDTDLKVQRFIKREPTLSSYLKEIDILKKMANDATSAFLSLPMGLFLVHCSEINEVKSFQKKQFF